MKAGPVRTTHDGGAVRVTAAVSSPGSARPFELWFEVPEAWTSSLDHEGGDPWLAALLLPAMRAAEPLEIDAPLSAELHEIAADLRAVYSSWLPAAVDIEVRAPRRSQPVPAGTATGLFFSCGVDSWYSLLRAGARTQRRLASVTHLVVVHGVDIDVGPHKADVADMLLANGQRAADEHGLALVPVSTNLRQLYTRTALSWRWGQAGALAAIGLLLQRTFARVVVAAGATNASIIVDPEQAAGRCHPLLLPMFSTAGCEVTVDGGEVSRLRKVEAVADAPVALDTLRVCWASHEPGYNCGRCAKCIRTMLELEIAGALGRCTTLPGVVDPQAVARLQVLFAHEIPMLGERLQRLAAKGADEAVLHGLEAAIARAEVDVGARAQAQDAIRSHVPPHAPFVLVDEDEIRFELARTHVHARPFTEHDGLFNGFPTDGAAAVQELERQRRGGAEKLVVWKSCRWVLDHYGELTAHLEAHYPVIFAGPDVVIFDLVPGPSVPGDPGDGLHETSGQAGDEMVKRSTSSSGAPASPNP